MGGVKTRRRGESAHRYWYKKGTDEKLTRILRVTEGKRTWHWGAREGDWYRVLGEHEIELR